MPRRGAPRSLGPAVAAVLAASPALADTTGAAEPVRLAYSRGAGTEACPTEASFRHAVMARLGYDPFRDDAKGEVRVAFSRAQGTLRGRLAIAGGGVRELSSGEDDCAELAASLAIATSIAIDPESVARPAAPPVAPAPVAPPPAAPAPSPPPPSAPPARERARPIAAPSAPLTVVLALGARASWLAMPGTALAPTVELGLRRGALSLAVEGRDDLGLGPSALGGAEVRTSLASGSALACAHRGRFGACALGTLGVLSASAAGVSREAATHLWAALGARAHYEQPLSGALSLRLSADVAVPLVRPVLHFDDNVVWEPDVALTLGGGGAVVARF